MIVSLVLGLGVERQVPSLTPFYEDVVVRTETEHETLLRVVALAFQPSSLMWPLGRTR